MSLCAGLTREQSNALYVQVLEDHDEKAMRQLCKEDLFFLLTIGCKRKDINRDWLYDRCREVEAKPDGMLDLWAREHYKSTLITFGLSIQDILKDPSVTIGIFSHTRPIAKAFLKQIKTELEQNDFLKRLFPDILYETPHREAALWSLDNGIVVKRPTNPKEGTVEAWGLVDGQPTSKHYSRLVYDDVVTRESVTTPDMIKKTNDAWALSLSLGAAGGAIRYIGTRYHFNDTWREIMENEAAVPRIYAATEDGTINGPSVFMDEETLETRRKGGSYTFSCQYLQNPIADSAQGFDEGWLKFYEQIAYDGTKFSSQGMNHYIVCDPAGTKKIKDTGHDFTAFWVVALGRDENYYVVDCVRDRLNLAGRTRVLFELHEKWKPLAVGYERYGMQSDIEHIEDVMNARNYRFDIVELKGPSAKLDRIKRLQPLFEYGRVWLPRRLMRTDAKGAVRDYVKEFVDEEYKDFPVPRHDDMLDSLSRVLDSDLGATFPKATVAVEGRVMKANNSYKVL